MTQLVTKGSSWRTLRRKAVVGASSLALVAGMGVALAPAASAAVPPTVTIDAPASISNDNTTPSDIDVNIQTGADALASGTTFSIQLTLPAGVAVAAGNPNVAIADTGLPAGAWGGATVSGQVWTNTYTTTAAFTANSSVDLTFTTKVDGVIPATATTPEQSITGDVGIKFFARPGGVGDPIATSATTKLVGNTAAKFSTSAVPAVVYGSGFNAKLVQDGGFPAATYSAIGYAKNTAGAWITAAEVRSVFARGVTKSGVVHKYIALNNTPFVGAAAGSANQDVQAGFYFDTATGSVVFGTLADSNTFPSGVDTYVTTFTPSPVSRSASKYTWTIIGNNGVAVRSAATSAAIPVPALGTKDAASVQFNLALPQFSDVTDANVFADAISAMAGAGYVQGYANGTFGIAQKVTRGEFAAFAARMLGDIPNGSSFGYTCSTATPSNFTDVANTSIFCDAINTLAKAGIVKGTSATKFSPNALVTRDQVAAFIYRMNAVGLNASVLDAPQATTPFKDVPKSNIFSGDIAWAAANGIVTGRTATTFAPAAKVLRQEAAGMLYRFGGTYGLF